jgi:hypothetical protein
MSLKPRRISITLPHVTAELLEQRSLQEGRALANLAAHLLERALTERALTENSGLAPEQRATVTQRSVQSQPLRHG